MPPKKDAKKAVQVKGQFQEVQDDTGIPKNYVEFNFKFTILQNKVENVLLFFEWPTQEKGKIEQVEMGYIEDWVKVDPNANPEEAYEVTVEKKMEPIRIDEAFAQTLCDQQCNIYFVNAEDGKVLHTYKMDYSILLLENQITFQNDKNKVLAVEDFKFELVADKSLLTPEFKQQLNPLMLNIIGAKQVPVNQNKKYQPVYVKYNFFGQQKIQSAEYPHGSKLKFDFKHVVLLGMMNHISLKEWISSKPLRVEFHDMDEIIKDDIKKNQEIIDVSELIREENERIQKILQEQQEKLAQAQAKQGKGPAVKAPAPKAAEKKVEKGKQKEKKKETKGMELIFEQPLNINSLNFGISEFYLTDLLKSNFKETKLRSFIYPNKVFEDKMSKNLDLNTTARKNLEKQLLNTSYLDNSAYILIKLQLSRDIGAFQATEVKKDDLASQSDTKSVQKNASKESKNFESKLAKLPTSQQNPDQISHFERVAFILPYKCEQFIKTIQDTVNEINLKGMNIQDGGLRALSSYALSAEERNNKQLDFVGGFEIMDNEFRVFILEGIQHKGMKELEEATKISSPNTETFKILRNNSITFKDRIYQDFGLEIKKVRLRENLREFLMKPDIYNRVKLPENICTTFIKFNEIRKCISLKSLVQQDLFPVSDNMIQIERKYSDSLSYEDIYGKENLNLRKSTKLSQTEQTQIALRKTTFVPEVTFQLNIEQNDLSKTEIQVTKRTNNKSTFARSQDIYPIRCTLMESGYDKPVYIYGSQRLNFYAEQRRELRERIQKDKNNFYTYSKDYLSLSIDPYDMEEEYKKNIQLQKQTLKDLNKPEFRSIPKKKIDKVMKRLHPTQIEEIATNPHHEQEKHTKEILKVTRGLPVAEGDKAEFQNYIPLTRLPFSEYEVIEGQKMTQTEKERLEREKKKADRDQFLNKLVGTEFVYTNSVTRVKDSQLDKFSGLLVDDAKKKGIRITKSKIASSKIHQDLYLKQYPPSIFIDEQYKENEKNTVLQRKFTMENLIADKNFFKFTTDDPMYKNKISKVKRDVEIAKIN